MKKVKKSFNAPKTNGQLLYEIAEDERYYEWEDLAKWERDDWEHKFLRIYPVCVNQFLRDSMYQIPEPEN